MSLGAAVLGRGIVTVLTSAVFLLEPPQEGRAFRNVQVGEPIENAIMPTLAGGKEPLLRADRRANVFLFFRPGQAHSEKAIAEIAACAREMAGKPVHWVTIVSDRADRAAVQALVDATKLEIPVVVDEGDALYGKLGTALHPVAGITDGAFALRAYQPFNELRFTPLIRARVQHVLGEIDDAALERILNPQQSEIDEGAAAASRTRKYAEVMLKAGNLDRALERARAAVELAPKAAEGHALLGDVLAAQGNCVAAREAYDKALALDATLAQALEGRKACDGK